MANYINNKDFLFEIAKSKISYCSFLSTEDAYYDLILKDINHIQENLEKGREARAERLSKLRHEEAQLALKNSGNSQKLKSEEFQIDPLSIKYEDIIFRVMTWEHIPMEPAKPKKESKVKIDEIFANDLLFEEDIEDKDVAIEIPEVKIVANMKYVKVNFPPFQHFKVSSDLTPIRVGKSHWKGHIDTGNFAKDHGSMTRKLADMFIKLCDRYATRSNWRSYTYNDEMRGQALLQLSQVGLQFDESKSNNPFSFYTTVTTNSFRRILNEEKGRQALRDDILESYNLNPSFTRQNEWNNYDD
jgi:hypothetical protein